jgi:MoaA/NifB/PqqE/SkfB family radical SAM enzyme
MKPTNLISLPRLTITLGYASGGACNNNCIFCAGQHNNPLEANPNPKLTLYQCRKEGARRVEFVGGEPTTRPDIIEIISYAHELGYKLIYLQTNGRMFYYPEFTKKVVDSGCNFVQISLHAPNAKLHDRITQVPGSFEQTVQGIKNLLLYDDKVNVDLTILFHKMNYKYLPATAKFISKELRGIQEIRIFPVDITENAYINRNKLIVKISDVKPFLETGLEILEKNDFKFHLSRIPFCVINKKHWKNLDTALIKKELTKYISPDGLRYTIFESCNECIMRGKCQGISEIYASIVGTDEFKPIRSR